MTTGRLAFIDWMKCLGMALIVLGHVGGAWINHLTPPFYPKQLGVAFFLFVAGFSLARERRPGAEVILRRLFEIYLFGIGFALLMSAITYVRAADLAESNYLPFFLGANVVLDDFPMNPTTWFIGTYTHAVLLWAIALRGVRVQPWMLVPVGLAEIAVRVILMDQVGLFPAYMLLSNWATVFLLGLCYGRQPAEEPRTGGVADLATPLAMLGLLAIAWPRIAWPALDPTRTFPFMRLAAGPALVSLVLSSACVTLLYAAYTWSTYRVARQLPGSGLVRFFARNTPIIFIAHMPALYALQGPLATWIDNRLMQVAILFLVCFVGLAGVSELIRRLIRPDRLRERLWSDRRGLRAGEPVAASDAERGTFSVGTIP